MKEAGSAPKIRYRWTMLAITGVINFSSNAFGTGSMAPLLPEIAGELNFTHTQLGIIWGALAMGIMLFSFVGGNFGDRYGVKRVITFALVFVAISSAGRALFPSFWGLSATMFLLGIGQAFAIPNLTKVIGQWFGTRELGTANGVLLVGAAFGSATGAVLAASVLSPLLGGWRGVMWLTGGFTLALVVMWALLAREQPPVTVSGQESPPPPGFVDGFRRVIRIRALWWLAIIETCLVGGNIAWMGMFPDILVARGMSAGTAGVYMSLGMWGAILPCILGPYASDRFGVRKLFIWTSLIVYTIAFSLQGFLMGASLAFVVLLSGIARGAVTPLIRTITLEVEGVRPQLGGVAIGLMFTVNRLGALILPIVMGMLIDYTGLYWPPLILLTFLSLVALCTIFFVKETGARVMERSGG